MALSPKILARLNYGKEIAVEVAAKPEMRAFVSIIPQVPDVKEQPDAYFYEGENRPRRRLLDPSLIIGYEIRWLTHKAKYTDVDWGGDYDIVLADKTTRIKRQFVGPEISIQEAVAPWLTDLSFFTHPLDLDSSLLDNWVPGYSDDPEKFSHLWLED